MTALGELMIDEDLRDLVTEKVNKLFGENWRLDGSDYSDVWIIKDMKGHHKIKIVDSNTDKILGLVEVDISTFINEEAFEEFIDAKFIEESIKIIKL